MVPKTCAYRLPDGSQCTEDFFGFGGEAEYCWKHQAYQNMTDEEKEKRKQIDDSIHALRNPDADIRLRAIHSLRATATVVTPGGDDDDYEEKTVYSKMDSSVIDALASALDDDNTEVRREAVWALPSPDLRTEMHFVTALGDVDESVRRIAAQQLMLDENPFAPSGDTRVFEALISALDDESPDVRGKAIISLGNRAHSQSSQALVNALKNDDFEVRWKAAYGLGTMNIRGVMKGSKEAVEPLIAALGDEKSLVREYAVKTLGEYDDLRSVEPCIRMLGDDDSGVRCSAADSLGKMSNRVNNALEGGWESDVDPGTVTNLLAAAVEPLIAALGDEVLLVRQHVVESLGNFGDLRAVETVIAALDDEELAVRKCAADALRVLGDRGTLDSLETTLATIYDDYQKANPAWSKGGGWTDMEGG